MRCKKRKCDKIDFHLPDSLVQSDKENFVGTIFVRNVLNASEGIQQINLFKEIESYLLQNDAVEDELQIIIDALCKMFYQAPHKSSHKRALNRIIQEISNKYSTVVEIYLKKSIDFVTNLSVLNESTEEIEIPVLHIIYLIDNLKLGKKVVSQNFHKVWKFISLLLKKMTENLKQEKNLQKINDIYILCQNILKLVTQFIQNCDQLQKNLQLNCDVEFQAASEDIRICLEYLLDQGSYKKAIEKLREAKLTSNLECSNSNDLEALTEVRMEPGSSEWENPNCKQQSRQIVSRNRERAGSGGEVFGKPNEHQYYEETKLNCRLNAAFVFCHYHYFSFGGQKLKDDVLSVNSTKFFLSSQLCIFSGIMAVLPLEYFMDRTNGHVLADIILQEIIKISKNSNSSEVLVLCTRSMLQWTSVIQNAFNSESMLDENKMLYISQLFCEKKFIKSLFEYVLYNRDHYIDSIRHLSKDIFRNILNIHVLSSGVEPSKSPLLKDMTIYLLKDLPSHSLGKYGMLSCIVDKIGTNTILAWHSSLPSELYTALNDCSLISHVSELCQVLFSRTLNQEDCRLFQNIWLVPLLEVLCNGSREQTNAISEHILPKLLEVKLSSLEYLLSELSIMWENNLGNSFSALISCLKLFHRQKGSINYLEYISKCNLIKAFFHADDQVRLSAFALLCENYKTTEPIDSNSFELIKCGLPFNINCQSPSFRQQLIAYMKKLFGRMHESGYALMKKQTSNYHANVSLKVILPSAYQEFLHWLKEYLFSCLHPGANFPRRVTALNLLHNLHETFQHSFPIVDSEIALQTLLYALQDTYENNKILVLKILSSESSLKLNGKDETMFQSALMLASSTKPPDTATAAYLFTYMAQCTSHQHIIQKHLMMMLLEKPGLSLTVSDISDSRCSLQLNTISLLMCKLKKELELAKKSLLEAAASAPLYGVLICIRSVLNDVNLFHEKSIPLWQYLIKELILLSLKVADVMEPIVCNSSPEGHLPMDTDDDSIAQLQAAVRRALGCRFQSAIVQENPSAASENAVIDIVKTHAVTAQLLLLCCWRTHKEVSLLFGDISEKVPLIYLESNTSHGILSISQMKDIGQYFIRQMSLVKHKGAFEQAQIGFTKLCNKLWRCHVPELNELPKTWLVDMILSIKGLKEDIKLCPTRRSAGLPFIIQTILASEPCFLNSSFFKNSMTSFLALAQPNVAYAPDIQVHALNILRTLFRDACLGEAVMPFVSKGLQISIEGFKSTFWAVRNSSTLLFSALMTRIFGVNRSHDEAGKKNKLSGKYFFSYYKELYYYLINELEHCLSSMAKSGEGNKISIQPSLYPILLVLGRLFPAPGEEDTILSIFVPFLEICTSNPIWKTRSVAARALVSFIPCEKIILNVELLLESLITLTYFDQNRIHGQMMQLRYLMEEIGVMPDSPKALLREKFKALFVVNFHLYTRVNKCASTRAAYFEIYLYAMILGLDTDDILFTTNLIKYVVEDFSEISSYPDKDNYLAIAASIMLFKICKLDEEDSRKITNLTSSLSPETIFSHLLLDHHKVVSCTLIEVLLWLLQNDHEISKCSPNFSDDVVGERVLKIVTLMDRKCFNVNKIKEDPYIRENLPDSFHVAEDQILMKQYCKLMNFMPSVLSSNWNFISVSHSCDLINKLEYILKKMEYPCRDDVTCELFLYSAEIVLALCSKYESYDENVNIFLGDNYGVVQKWLEKFQEFAYPDNSTLFRQTVVSVLNLLVEKYLFPKSKLLGTCSSCLWQALMLLLIDDEPEIKHRASEIVVKMNLAENKENNVSSAVPFKAVDLMVGMFVKCLKDSQNCMSMLIKWMISSNSVSLDFMNDEQPFDKGELNIFSEGLQITRIVSNHLSSYLATVKSSGGKISSQTISCWNHQKNKNLTFAETITLCLSEANWIFDKFQSRGAISPILDTCFNDELIQISQRLAVAVTLLQFSEILPDFKELGDELLRRFQSLNFRTFFIEDIISNILAFITHL